jgi:hypothetical protein
METVITMIILTGTAVLFLSNVFRQVRDERERTQQRRVPPSRPASNTEQFLEEVNRRRQQASERGKSAPPVRRVILTPAPAPVSRREVTSRKPPRTDRPRQTSAPLSRPAAASSSRLLDVVPADRPGVEAEPASTPASVEPIRSGAGKVTVRPPPRLLAQLTPLLRSRETLRAAFVLHEILGPPLCHHKRVHSR